MIPGPPSDALAQEPPRGLGASKRICVGPPSAETFFNFPSAKNATCRLSGDQNGYAKSPASASGCAAREFSDRTQIWCFVESPVTNASREPSGDINAGPASNRSANAAFSGGEIEKRIGRGSGGFWWKYRKVTTASATPNTAVAAIQNGEACACRGGACSSLAWATHCSSTNTSCA